MRSNLKRFWVGPVNKNFIKKFNGTSIVKSDKKFQENKGQNPRVEPIVKKGQTETKNCKTSYLNKLELYPRVEPREKNPGEARSSRVLDGSRPRLYQGASYYIPLHLSNTYIKRHFLLYFSIGLIESANKKMLFFAI